MQEDDGDDRCMIKLADRIASLTVPERNNSTKCLITVDISSYLTDKGHPTREFYSKLKRENTAKCVFILNTCLFDSKYYQDVIHNLISVKNDVYQFSFCQKELYTIVLHLIHTFKANNASTSV